MWSTVFFPIITAIFKIAVLEFAIIVSYCLSILKHSNSHHYSDSLLDFFHVSFRKKISSILELSEFSSLVTFQALNIIACIWNMLFISALNQLSLASAFGTWYWTYDKSNVPFFTMVLAAARSLWYHSGTAAFGGLFVTVCRFLRLIFSSRSVTWQFEHILKQFNRSAYVMCAIHAKGLCASAFDAYQLVLRNVLRCPTLDLVIFIVFSFGKLLVTLATAVGGGFYFMNSSPMMPVHLFFVMLFGAFWVAGTFFDVYEMAVNALILCARKWGFC